MRFSQCSGDIGSPVRRSQARSWRPRASGRPVNQRVPRGSRRRRNASRWAVKSISFWSARAQSIQVISLSWQYGLLLPPWLWPNSSPAASMGVPCANSVVASKARCRRRRRALTTGSEVGPSQPQFQLRLWPWPSRLFSPLAWLWRMS